MVIKLILYHDKGFCLNETFLKIHFKGNRSFSYNPKCVPYIKLQGLHELHEILFINDKYCDPWPFLISKYYEVLLMLFSLVHFCRTECSCMVCKPRSKKQTHDCVVYSSFEMPDV